MSAWTYGPCVLLPAIGFLWRSAKKTTSDSQERSNVWSFTRAAVALVAALVDDLVAAWWSRGEYMWLITMVNNGG